MSVRRGLSPMLRARWGASDQLYSSSATRPPFGPFSRNRSPRCQFCLRSCFLYSFGQGLSLGCGRAGQQGLVANARRPPPGSLLSEKSPEKRSFFCVQRCRLTVGDKPLLPRSRARGHWLTLTNKQTTQTFMRSFFGEQKKSQRWNTTVFNVGSLLSGR